uniref:Ac110 n=1 Tax=Lymantria dispar multicapsid nuclear polyhedrosis virus TaxID=10449 RepID=A0A1B1MQX0_NPVLD|nr:hypothetical protein [Lymantria dispar multiple nucleopolyhedrovirus]
MYVQLVFMVTVFVVCLFLLLALKSNRKQINKLIYYQYKYIPEPLISLVSVKKLKEIY